MGSDVDSAKQAVRERIWTPLEREDAVPPGVRGHIPDFVGTDRAATRLAGLHAWRAGPSAPGRSAKSTWSSAEALRSTGSEYGSARARGTPISKSPCWSTRDSSVRTR